MAYDIAGSIDTLVAGLQIVRPQQDIFTPHPASSSNRKLRQRRHVTQRVRCTPEPPTYRVWKRQQERVHEGAIVAYVLAYTVHGNIQNEPAIDSGAKGAGN